jgi:hypothetical protein
LGDTSQPKSAEEAARDYLENVMSQEVSATGDATKRAGVGRKLVVVVEISSTASRAKAKYFSAKRIGHTGESLRACSLLLTENGRTSEADRNGN